MATVPVQRMRDVHELKKLRGRWVLPQLMNRGYTTLAKASQEKRVWALVHFHAVCADGRRPHRKRSGARETPFGVVRQVSINPRP